ncbi:MAG: DUF2510 domain-containing protein [Candidatus Nanopelagicales bacterium]
MDRAVLYCKIGTNNVGVVPPGASGVLIADDAGVTPHRGHLAKTPLMQLPWSSPGLIVQAASEARRVTVSVTALRVGTVGDARATLQMRDGEKYAVVELTGEQGEWLDYYISAARPAQQSPPAGWWPDPDGSGRQRFWDGHNWTEHFA